MNEDEMSTAAAHGASPALRAQDDFHPNEMCWRFWHEDEDCNRIVISKNRKFNSAGHDHARILLQEVIEDWAWNEPGEWDREGSNHDVLVIGPKNMAGRWNVRIFATPCVTAERSELDEPRGLSAADEPCSEGVTPNPPEVS